MALDFKIEWFRDGEKPSGEGMFLHTKIDLPCYQDFITKEDYTKLTDDEKCDFVTGLFDIPGVVEASVKAYRVYVIKADLYTWEEVSPQVVSYTGTALGQSVYNELPGSRLTIESSLQRRAL